MSDTIRCPGCGQENPAGSPSCSHCNYPLQRPPIAPGPAREREPEIIIRRPLRRRRRRQAAHPTALALWLFIGVLTAIALVWTAYSGFRRTNAPPVEGANEEQSQLVDSLRGALRRDSTDVDALVAYANILYDTANWRDAAEYYARALALDSSHVHAIVDLGVCWYNLGDGRRAEELFQLALKRDAAHPIALFNLGIVNERAGEWDASLRYFHRALESSPPEPMRDAIVQHMRQILERTGRTPPPLEGGGMPPGMPPGSQPGEEPAPGGDGE
jgi:tetratricopeptide (TPR) repeat protein